MVFSFICGFFAKRYGRKIIMLIGTIAIACLLIGLGIDLL